MSTDNLSPSAKQLQIPLQEKLDPTQKQNNSDQTINVQIQSRTNEDNPIINSQQQQRIDTQALNGLRGIVAIHIMIFHSLLYSKLQWNILGSVQMPLFFLISGYIFGLSDGKQKYYPTKCCTELKHFVDNDDETGTSSFMPDNQYKHFDGKNYYQRRMARTLPLYYLTNLMCIPLAFCGHGWIVADGSLISTLILTVFVATTWFGKPSTLNGPSWFVSTIWFFYWIFPSLVPRLQSIENVRKQKWVCYYFWIQMFIGFILFFGTVWVIPTLSFFIATFWPPSRLPVFIMGVLSGLLRNDGLGIHKSCDAFTVDKWRKVSDWSGIIMLIVFIVLSVVECAFVEVASGLWLQLTIAWFQLYFITALTFDEGTSIMYKFLTSKVMLYFGRISYAVYLVHEPFIQYICWIVYGAIKRPDCEYDSSDECSGKWDIYNDKRLMPLWCIPILWIVSIVVAIILNRLLEEPLRKWLRPAKK